MTNAIYPLTILKREPRHTMTLNRRLLEVKRASVDRFAEMQGVTTFDLAWRILRQAVEYCNQQVQVGGAGPWAD
jgi:hypothetical protein